jgi:hypothetical protein
MLLYPSNEISNCNTYKRVACYAYRDSRIENINHKKFYYRAMIRKNYKTAIQGTLILLTVAAMLLNYITVEQMGAAIGVFTGLGLLASKDYDTK